MKLPLLAQELLGGLLDGRQIREIEPEENGLLACLLLERCDGLVGFLLASRCQVYLRAMLEEYLDGL